MNDADHDMIPSGNGDAHVTSRDTKNDAPEEVPRSRLREIGGRQGPEPTRYGDWEYKGRCIDF